MTQIKKINLCIFDMDGLLIDSEKGMWFINEEIVFKELGYDFDYDYFIDYIGASLTNYKNAVLNKYGNDFDFDQFFKILIQKNLKFINDGKLKMMPGALELLQFLNKNHIPCRIATSTQKDLVNTILKKLDIEKYFEKVVTGDEVINGKPAPDIYLKALGTYQKEKTLIFEDSHNGALSALKAHINLVLVPDVSHLTKKDKQDAYCVIDKLSDAISIIKEINNLK